MIDVNSKRVYLGGSGVRIAGEVMHEPGLTAEFLYPECHERLDQELRALGVTDPKLIARQWWLDRDYWTFTLRPVPEYINILVSRQVRNWESE